MRSTWMPAVLLCLAEAALSRGPWKPAAGPWGGEALCMASAGNTLYVGTPSGLYRSTDNGGSWTAVELTEGPVRALASTGSGLLVGTWGRGVFRVTGDGRPGWQTGLKEGFITSLAGSGKILYAGSDGGAVSRSIDGGKTWRQIRQPPRGQLGWVRALVLYGPRVLAATEKGLALWMAEEGGWTTVLAGPSVAPGSYRIRTFAQSGTTLWAGTDVGKIIGSADSGKTWKEAGPGLGRPINALVATGAVLLAGTEGGGTWLSTDVGTTWKEANAGLRSLDINALQAAGGDFLAATPMGIFASADPGRGWRASSQGLHVVKITGLVASRTHLHAATAEAGVYHSADGGASWVASGPGLELGTLGVNLDVQGKDLYAGTTAGVFHTADFGKSWSVLLRPPEETLYPAQIAAPGPGDLIATFPGKILRSRDKGRTWKPFEIGMTNFDSHFIVRHDGTLFLGNDAGVLRCPVDGDRWESARSGLPAFTIFKAFIETGGHLLVGTDDGIFVSADRGDSWQVSDTSAFGVHAFARFGSEVFALTGSVDILHSRDHGRSWRVFEEKLPEGRPYHKMGLVVAGGALYVGTGGRGVWRCALD